MSQKFLDVMVPKLMAAKLDVKDVASQFAGAQEGSGSKIQIRPANGPFSLIEVWKRDDSTAIRVDFEKAQPNLKVGDVTDNPSQFKVGVLLPGESGRAPAIGRQGADERYLQISFLVPGSIEIVGKDTPVERLNLIIGTRN